jgi:hypothetical protein
MNRKLEAGKLYIQPVQENILVLAMLDYSLLMAHVTILEFMVRSHYSPKYVKLFDKNQTVEIKCNCRKNYLHVTIMRSKEWIT